MQIHPFRALSPILEKIESNDHFFAAVKEAFPHFLQQGFYQTEPAALYLCAIQSPQRRALGLIGGASIHDYLHGAIKRHEHTILAKEEVQIRLWKAQQAMIKPVLLAYPPVEAISTWMQQIATEQAPNWQIDFVSDEERYQLWAIRDPAALQYIQELFAAFVPRAYIADGHHRCSSAALAFQRQGTEDQFLAAFFPANQLNIQAFHRILDQVTDRLDTLLNRLEPYFVIEPLPRAEAPGQKFELCFLVENRAFRLTWRADFLEHYRWEKVILDTQLFNEVVLPNVFDIVNVRQEPRLSYAEGVKGVSYLESLQRSQPQRVAFALYPIDPQEMMLLADHDQALPPKSTWFEPRMKNGVLVKPYTL